MEILVRIPWVVTLSGYFAVKMVLTGYEILQCDVTIQIKAIEQFFAVGVYYDVKDNTNFWVCESSPKM